MKVWEAIEMLQSMDANKEVTVTMGRSLKVRADDPTYGGVPNQPVWVIGKEFWPSRNEITCKMH